MKLTFAPRIAAQRVVAQPRVQNRLLVRGSAEKAETKAKAEVEEEHFTGSVDFVEIADIIRKINETDIVEFELKGKKFSLSMKKKEALEKHEAPAPQPMTMQMPYPMPYPFPSAAPAPAAPAPAPAPAPAAAAPAPAPAAPKPAAPAAKGKPEGIEVTSPMAGTFYRSPAPGEPSFVKEGDKVQKGQTIGIIEAMKLMNEIEAEISGTITAIVVGNGETVLPGQALVVIKP